MKVIDGFVICNVGGKTVAVASGALSDRFNGMINLNGTGEILFRMLQNETDEETLVSALTSKFDVSREVAEKDVKAYLASLDKAGLLEK